MQNLMLYKFHFIKVSRIAIFGGDLCQNVAHISTVIKAPIRIKPHTYIVKTKNDIKDEEA